MLYNCGRLLVFLVEYSHTHTLPEKMLFYLSPLPHLPVVINSVRFVQQSASFKNLQQKQVGLFVCYVVTRWSSGIFLVSSINIKRFESMSSLWDKVREPGYLRGCPSESLMR